MRGAIHHSPYMPSWRSAQLKQLYEPHVRTAKHAITVLKLLSFLLLSSATSLDQQMPT
jgi:hypothetical protein